MRYMAAMAPWFREVADRGATLSECNTYRYHLWRYVGPQERVATFIMLNPSAADAVVDDPTIRRCMGFARTWDCGRLVVVNLFAFRSVSPAKMKRQSDPVGPENDEHIIRAAKAAALNDGKIVCAWGVHGKHQDRDKAVLAILNQIGVRPLCLAMSKDGMPKHPLYLPRTAEPVEYRARATTSPSGIGEE